MKNTFNKVTQSLFEAFKGPRTKDFEFEKINQEYLVCKERMLNLKNQIDSYPSKLEGYQIALDGLIGNFEVIFSKEQEGYFQFMSNVLGAHKALKDKLLAMKAELEEKFIQKHGSCKCKEILGYDLSTEEGMTKIMEERLLET